MRRSMWGMWRMLQQPVAEDFVLATGETHAMREFAELAFRIAGIEIKWQGQAKNEIGIDAKTGKHLVEIDPKYYRPTEVDLLIGDAGKAKQKLGLQPKTSFEELVEIMVKADVEKVRKRGF